MTKKERDSRFAEIVEFGCLACRLKYDRATPPTIHHVRRGGRRRDDRFTIGLCPAHHQKGPSGEPYVHSRASFEAWLGYTEWDLFRITEGLLESRGWTCEADPRDEYLAWALKEAA